MLGNFEDILTGRVDIKRFTPCVLDEVAVAASITADRNPASSCRLEVTVVGATVGAGSITVTGSTIETFSFSVNNTQLGTRNFTTVSGLTLAGISSGFVSVKAVTPMGQPINQEETIYSSVPVRFYAVDGRIRMLASGNQRVAKHKFMVSPDYTVQENDLMYAISGISGLTLGQVTFVDSIMAFDGTTHHCECEVVQP